MIQFFSILPRDLLSQPISLRKDHPYNYTILQIVSIVIDWRGNRDYRKCDYIITGNSCDNVYNTCMDNVLVFVAHNLSLSISLKVIQTY